jgi:diguanylate cyclase (GGDEF)-like protein
LLTDSVLFLFNVETASVMGNKGNHFKTAITSGKLSADVAALSIEADNPLISRLVKDFTFTSTNNILEISKLGLPDSIKSMHIFPLSDNYGLLVIYNSLISKEETYGILEFCKLASLVLRNLHLRIVYDKFADSIKTLNNSILKLTHVIHHMDVLYDTVIDTATELLNAEKGSVMIPDEENRLMIKAIKGLSKWLTQDIRLQIGEGIAGKVFKEGKPFFVENMENLQLPYAKSKRHYKTSSFISVPLKLDPEVFGVLNIADKITGEDFTEHDLTLLNYFSTYASLAIKMSDYYSMAGKLKELSITDPLTSLFNRRYFYERLVEEMHRSERYNFIFSLAIFDIDDFKLFNDSEGHLAGDEVLKELASVAHRSLRSNDIISRFGGEEFIVLMPQTDKEEAFIVAERMRKNIKESFTRTWENFPHPTITVSIGISSFPEDGKSSENLIKNADLALYKAKAVGKNKTVISTLYKRL